jgi:spore coat polysaccharide biosynthesis protein SpsF (cytidylyltransferase family)
MDIAERIDDPVVREHVSLYFYENQDEYKIVHLEAPNGLRAPDVRLQLDYEEDLHLIREIYDALEPKYGEYFGVHEIINLLIMRPELMEINSHCEERLPR